MNPEEVPQAPITPEPTPLEPSSLKQIRTFQGDVADALRSQSESLVSIQRQEQVRREEQPHIQTHRAERENPAVRLLLLIIGSLILLGLGTVIGWYSYKEFINKSVPPVVETPVNRFLPSAGEATIDTTGLDRTGLIAKVAETSLGSRVQTGEVQHIVFIKEGGELGPVLLTTQEFFKLFGARAPGSLVRAFDDLFMFGVLEAPSPSTFMIIKLASFENAFAGMLTWEAKMLEDLGPLFLPPWRVQALEVTDAIFEDVIVRNMDTRILFDAEGVPLLIYSFFDTQTLIITDQIESLNTLTSRLILEKLSR